MKNDGKFDRCNRAAKLTTLTTQQGGHLNAPWQYSRLEKKSYQNGFFEKKSEKNYHGNFVMQNTTDLLSRCLLQSVRARHFAEMFRTFRRALSLFRHKVSNYITEFQNEFFL